MDAKDIVFGIQPVLEALRSGKSMDKILLQRDIIRSPKVTSIMNQAKALGIPISNVPLPKLHKITRKNHQGVIAMVAAIQFMPLHMVVQNIYDEGQSPFLLILDRVTDVRNFGAICRTAECAGVHAIVIPQKGAAQVNSDAMRTSSGALNYIPVCRVLNLEKTLVFLQESGLQVVACTEKAEAQIYDIDLNIPLAIVMGSEEDGISSGILRKVDHQAKIPLVGQVSSLNVSVATGVSLFEAVRQRSLEK